jgi:predicted lipid carrier protein YhbT
MIGIKDLNLQFITNEAGEKISVVLPLSKFQDLLQDLEDLAVVAERREEPTSSHEALLTELKRDGLI